MFDVGTAQRGRERQNEVGQRCGTTVVKQNWTSVLLEVAASLCLA